MVFLKSLNKNILFESYAYFSSGYGSEAVSSSNLTSDDCLSVRSCSVDETPDSEHRKEYDEERNSGNLITSTVGNVGATNNNNNNNITMPSGVNTMTTYATQVDKQTVVNNNNIIPGKVCSLCHLMFLVNVTNL